MHALEQRLGQLNSYLARDPANPLLLLERGWVQFQSGHLDEAEADAQQAMTQRADWANALVLLGAVAVHRGNAAQALENLERALAIDPALPFLVRYLLQAYLMLGRYEDCVNCGNNAMQQGSFDAPCGPVYLRALHAAGRTAEALQWAEQTLQAVPEESARYGVLATILLDAEQLPAAETQARSVLASAPEDVDANIVMGMLALKARQPAVAENHFEPALRQQPGNGRAWLGRGLTLMLQGHLAEAGDALERAVASQPEHVGTRNTLAWCQIAAGQPEAARGTLEGSLELDRNFADTWGALAISRIFTGELETARHNARQALGLDRNSPSGLYATVILRGLAQDKAASRALLEELKQKIQASYGISVF